MNAAQMLALDDERQLGEAPNHAQRRYRTEA
jgi:hypothetical protein